MQTNDGGWTGVSFTYIRNSKGPSILPCGTPDKTGRGFEIQ